MMTKSEKALDRYMGDHAEDQFRTQYSGGICIICLGDCSEDSDLCKVCEEKQFK
jgi:hypothetical protein